MRVVAISDKVLVLRHGKETERNFLARADKLHYDTDPQECRMKQLRAQINDAKRKIVEAQKEIEAITKERENA